MLGDRKMTIDIKESINDTRKSFEESFATGSDRQL